ncbi:MAG: hypothetical protein H7Z14_11860 [Anaerolineae bacterium]|nr:hypothetical protein [Phycisphaerae bacterium]
MFRVALFALVLSCASSSFAQIIYEPVRYQYGDQNKFYYGGSDPRIIQHAMGPRDAAGRWGRVNGFDFVSGNIDTHREVSGQPERTFTDALGYQNARIYGFTATDARNEAYADIPTYFRKRDLLNAAIPTARGWVVPAQAQPIPFNPRATITVTGGRAMVPRPMMIIPKKALEKKLTEKQNLASAKS